MAMAAVIHEKGPPEVFRWEEIKLAPPGEGEVQELCVGEHDFEAFTVDAMRETICLWYRSAKIEMLSGSGHYPMAETPIYFLTVVENFLKSVAA